MAARLILRVIRVFLCAWVASVLTPAVASAQDPAAGFPIGIIGLVHGHAWGHLQRMADMPGIDLVGVADPHADLRQEAEKYAPGVTQFEDYRKLLRDRSPKAVWAFVENDRHLEIAEVCAPLGIHLIFEKPMAASYDQAQRMLALAREHKIKLMVNYQMAWWPENYTAYDFARSGKIGKVWRVRSIVGHGGPGPRGAGEVRRERFFAWLNDESRGGGALMDFACYGAVWLRWYLGVPNSVYAVTRHTRPERYQTNTSSTILASFSGGDVGIIEGSWDLPRSFQEAEVFGDKGSVLVGRDRIEAYQGRERTELAPGTLPEGRKDPISYFISAVQSDGPIDGIVGAEFNLDVMAIIEAARQSAESGKPVILPFRSDH